MKCPKCRQPLRSRPNPEEDLEHDEFIQMPPVKKWTARIKIKSIEKAKIRIVEPD